MAQTVRGGGRAGRPNSPPEIANIALDSANVFGGPVRLNGYVHKLIRRYSSAKEPAGRHFFTGEDDSPETQLELQLGQ
jgi:hypothetical protein